eukprot:1799873-Rhodomonas_salina.2
MRSAVLRRGMRPTGRVLRQATEARGNRKGATRYVVAVQCSAVQSIAVPGTDLVYGPTGLYAR